MPVWQPSFLSGIPCIVLVTSPSHFHQTLQENETKPNFETFPLRVVFLQNSKKGSVLDIFLLQMLHHRWYVLGRSYSVCPLEDMQRRCLLLVIFIRGLLVFSSWPHNLTNLMNMTTYHGVFQLIHTAAQRQLSCLKDKLLICYLVSVNIWGYFYSAIENKCHNALRCGL